MSSEKTKSSRGNILVAPLNWGLGHATRCIPIIKALEDNGFNPILASDGQALTLLRVEFPHLQTVELPGYGIQYQKAGRSLKLHLLFSLPRFIRAAFREKTLVRQIIADNNITGIISDNRPGVRSHLLPSVYITHQLNVMSGSTTWLTGMVHRTVCRKFSEIWIPDVEFGINLSGELGHLRGSDLSLRYIGPLSRFKKQNLAIRHKLMILLSGPEPQRGSLEKLLLSEIKDFDGNILFVRGVVETQQEHFVRGNVTTYNFMTSHQLETAMNESTKILCRSGYTTIMDLAKIQKKAFFIPTPGQYEQEYLARRMRREGFLPCAQQSAFRIENLYQTDVYGGLPDIACEPDWAALFGLFKREGKLRTTADLAFDV